MLCFLFVDVVGIVDVVDVDVDGMNDVCFVVWFECFVFEFVVDVVCNDVDGWFLYENFVWLYCVGLIV